MNSDFTPEAKAQPTVNKRNYICGLGARFGYERVEASIQTAATKVTNIVSFIYCGRLLPCLRQIRTHIHLDWSIWHLCPIPLGLQPVDFRLATFYCI